MANKHLTSPSKPGASKGKYVRRDKGTGQFSHDQSGRYQDSHERRSVVGDLLSSADKMAKGLEKHALLITARPVSSPRRTASAPKRRESHFYPKEIFSNQAEYDASVDSVVARIKSGVVQARTPDE